MCLLWKKLLQNLPRCIQRLCARSGGKSTAWSRHLLSKNFSLMADLHYRHLQIFGSFLPRERHVSIQSILHPCTCRDPSPSHKLNTCWRLLECVQVLEIQAEQKTENILLDLIFAFIAFVRVKDTCLPGPWCRDAGMKDNKFVQFVWINPFSVVAHRPLKTF